MLDNSIVIDKGLFFTMKKLKKQKLEGIEET